jgi:hypothetical protein
VRIAAFSAQGGLTLPLRRDFAGLGDLPDVFVPAAFKPQRKLLVGGGGITLEAFLSRPAKFWIKRNNGKKEGRR